MWPISGIYAITLILPGTTILILFKAKSGTDFNIGYHVNAYETEALRRFSYNARAGLISHSFLIFEAALLCWMSIRDYDKGSL